MEYFDTQLPYMRRNQSFVLHNAENRGLARNFRQQRVRRKDYNNFINPRDYIKGHLS
jgi:hypothetical protein